MNRSDKLNFQVIPPVEADSSTADQANSHVPIIVYNSPQVDPVLSWFNAVMELTYFEIHINIISPFAPRSTKWYLSFAFCD